MREGFGFGLLAVMFATISWGVQLPLAKDAFAVVDPFHLTAARYVIAASCLALILVAREGFAALSWRGHAPALVGFGTIGICASPTLVFWGMSMSSAEHAVVIITLQPMIAVIAYWLLRGTRPPAFTLGCIAVAFTGVVMVVTRGELAVLESPRQVLGDLIVLAGAACWVAYTIGIGNLPRWSIWRITVLTMIPGALATVAVTAVLVAAGAATVPGIDAWRASLWELAYLSFVGVLLAMLGWNLGSRRIGVLNATLFINCMPVTTFCYRALQGHRFSALELLGAGLVIAALIANNLEQRRRARQALARQARAAGA